MKEKDIKQYIETSSNNITSEKYYYPNLIFEIFNKIRNKENKDKLRLDVSGNPPNAILIISFKETYSELFSTKYVYENSENDIKSFEKIIEVLKNDDVLNNLVKDYEKNVNWFYCNNKRTAFFECIEELYNKIVNQNCSMNRKGKCIKCPPIGLIDFLTQFLLR